MKRYHKTTYRDTLYRLLLTFGIIYILTSCNDNPNDSIDNNIYPIPEQIDDGWETASLASVGLRESALRDMLVYLSVYTDHNIHSIVVVRNNKLVFEEYFQGDKFNLGQYTGETGFDRNDTHNLCSATKSFTSALVGIAIDNGFIQSLDQKVFDFFPEYADLLISVPEKQNLTLKHLLTMSSGIEWDDETYYYNDPRNDLYQLFTASDPIRYILSKDIIVTPGTVFEYRNGNTNLLGAVVQKSSGQRLDNFAQHYLFDKLGITELEWQMLPNNNVFCSGDLRLRPRDMAKFGKFFLDKGIWEQEQIISEDWINESVQPRFSPPPDWWEDGYGYQWWLKTFHIGLNNYESYFAQGWGGQFIFVFFELNMVVVFTGGNYFDLLPNLDILDHYILRAVY